MTFFAKAPLVIVRAATGADVYVYSGYALPEGVDKETLKKLVAEDFVTEQVTEVNGQPVEPTEGSSEVERPAEAGPGSGKSAWASYAEHKGVVVEADASRDDIIAAVSAAGH